MENGTEIDSIHYCPNCDSTLETQFGFDPKRGWWECQQCGEMLFGEGIYEGERFPSVMWFCDECNDFLNAQAGFNDLTDTWTCKKCGHSNEISENALSN